MKHQYGTKSTFVRLNPSLSAREVVKLAKTQGIKLTVGYVHSIRHMDRKVAARGRSANPVRDPDAADTKLRQLIGELGLIRSRGIVDEMERRVA